MINHYSNKTSEIHLSLHFLHMAHKTAIFNTGNPLESRISSQLSTSTDRTAVEDKGISVVCLSLRLLSTASSTQPGLMKDHGQQARASENFAGPVDFETPRPDFNQGF